MSDKSGLVEFARALCSHKIELVSTGGTAEALRAAGLEVVDVAKLTGFPEMLDGRVKTLHPAIHGGILADLEDPVQAKALEAHGILPIDLVAGSLYPFQQTVAAGGDVTSCVENIDIGGPAMLRAAAKNHARVLVLATPASYDEVIEELDASGGCTTLASRRAQAARAYAHCAAYDAAVANWAGELWDDDHERMLLLAGERVTNLRYGENSHQSAASYRLLPSRPGVLGAGASPGQGAFLQQS